MKILLAEDDPITHQLLYHTLSGWGYETICVMDGGAAWEQLQTQDAPNLLILDWMMPGLTGLEICQRLRAEASGTYTYILLLTGKMEQQDIIQGLEAGADDYLTKPFDPRELQVRLKTGERILNLETSLIHSLNALKTAETLRQEFIYALTHDLRSPLSANQRALEVLLKYNEKGETSDRVHTLVETMFDSNAHLLKLVNQLLEHHQVETTSVLLAMEWVALDTLTDVCFKSLQPLAEAKQIRCINHLSSTFGHVFCDPQQISRVMTNLMSNAIANVPPESCIEVSGEIQDGIVSIFVKDNGQGIHPNLLPHLFERYYLSAARINKIGTGMGLSICKALVEQHGGKIRVESRLHEGTCFSFTLPQQGLSPTE